ncbi:MAG TPA: hypothetical protein VFO30_00810 [Chthoniobacterales bacterium]|nr:hypothetical protein [Chthoniobacterales bacterium]
MRVLRADQFKQLHGGMFNLDMPVLTRPAFDREQRAPVDVAEIAIGKFVADFCMFVVSFIDTEVPLPVFTKSM